MSENQETIHPYFDQLHDMLRRSFDLYCRRIIPESLAWDGAMFITDRNASYITGCVFGDFPDEQNRELPLRAGESWRCEHIGMNAVGVSAQSRKPEFIIDKNHSSYPLQNYHTLSTPIFSKSGDMISIFGLVLHPAGAGQEYYLLVQSLSAAYYSSLDIFQIESESQKRDIVFQAAKKMYSKIDAECVLSEVIHCLKETFPNIDIELYLSQDKPGYSLPVKPLCFQGSGNELCTRAYMEARLISNLQSNEYPSLVAAPLVGKQGVYGVLYLKSSDVRLDETDIQLISMIADSAGTAFENARLYEQSNLLIKELSLINEITVRLNQSLKLNEIFNYASNELIHIFDADFCCILQLDKESGKMVVQTSNLPEMNNEIFSMDYGFSGVVYHTREPLIISDYLSEPKVNSKLMEKTGSRSLLASPIMVDGEVVGVILITHRQPSFFSYNNYKLLQVLSVHIGLAIANASLHSEVRRMVITDQLTGLYTRHYLDEQVNMSQRKDFCGSLIVIDIDYFKQVNDTYGHQIGDKILKEVSYIIRSSVREKDIAARWGGEEIAIYLPQSTVEQTIRIAERIRIRVAAETEPQVTISCGIADWSWEDEKISVETLFCKADMALYDSKNSGRNQIRIGK
jgi:diguanylate cyclase (GGDEF)-like protein